MGGDLKILVAMLLSAVLVFVGLPASANTVGWSFTPQYPYTGDIAIVTSELINCEIAPFATTSKCDMPIYQFANRSSFGGGNQLFKVEVIDETNRVLGFKSFSGMTGSGQIEFVFSTYRMPLLHLRISQGNVKFYGDANWRIPTRALVKDEQSFLDDLKENGQKSIDIQEISSEIVSDFWLINIQLNTNLSKSLIANNKYSVFIDRDADGKSDYSMSTTKTMNKELRYFPVSISPLGKSTIIPKSKCSPAAAYAGSFLIYRIPISCFSPTLKVGFQAQIYDARYKTADKAPNSGFSSLYNSYSETAWNFYCDLFDSQSFQNSSLIYLEQVDGTHYRVRVDKLKLGDSLTVVIRQPFFWTYQNDYTEPIILDELEGNSRGVKVNSAGYVWTHEFSFRPGLLVVEVVKNHDEILTNKINVP